jgi:hypothetical protein
LQCSDCADPAALFDMFALIMKTASPRHIEKRAIPSTSSTSPPGKSYWRRIFHILNGEFAGSAIG